MIPKDGFKPWKARIYHYDKVNPLVAIVRNATGHLLDELEERIYVCRIELAFDNLNPTKKVGTLEALCMPNFHPNGIENDKSSYPELVFRKMNPVRMSKTSFDATTARDWTRSPKKLRDVVEINCHLRNTLDAVPK